MKRASRRHRVPLALIGVFGLALLVAACGSDDATVSTGRTRAQGVDDVASTTTVPTQSTAPPGVVSVRLELPSRTIIAGTSLPGVVVITNNTGAAVQAARPCLERDRPFQVLLMNDDQPVSAAWRLCAGRFMLPVGESRFEFTIVATHSVCSSNPIPDMPFAVCMADGNPPPLAPGDYRATLFQIEDLLPPPEPVIVRVTS